MSSLIDRLKASARPAAISACVAIASLMAEHAEAANNCQQQTRSIGQEAAQSSGNSDRQRLTGMLGAAMGSFLGDMVCGPDQNQVRRQEQEAQAQRRLEERERQIRERERQLQQREREMRQISRPQQRAGR